MACFGEKCWTMFNIFLGLKQSIQSSCSLFYFIMGVNYVHPITQHWKFILKVLKLYTPHPVKTIYNVCLFCFRIVECTDLFGCNGNRTLSDPYVSITVQGPLSRSQFTSLYSAYLGQWWHLANMSDPGWPGVACLLNWTDHEGLLQGFYLPGSLLNTIGIKTDS